MNSFVHILLIDDNTKDVVLTLDAFRETKRNNIVKRISVIILSSFKEEGDRALSDDFGANSYLLKPVSFDGFVEVVKKIDNYWFSLNITPQ